MDLVRYSMDEQAEEDREFEGIIFDIENMYKDNEELRELWKQWTEEIKMLKKIKMINLEEKYRICEKSDLFKNICK